MAKTVGSIVGIKPEAEADGGHMIQVADFGEKPFEVWIRPDQVAQLIATLQTGAIHRAMAGGQTPSFPILTIEDVGLAHQGRATELLVKTAQTGYAVFQMSDSMAERAKQELKRLKTHRAAGGTA